MKIFLSWLKFRLHRERKDSIWNCVKVHTEFLPLWWDDKEEFSARLWEISSSGEWVMFISLYKTRCHFVLGFLVNRPHALSNFLSGWRKWRKKETVKSCCQGHSAGMRQCWGSNHNFPSDASFNCIRLRLYLPVHRWRQVKRKWTVVLCSHCHLLNWLTLTPSWSLLWEF